MKVVRNGHSVSQQAIAPEPTTAQSELFTISESIYDSIRRLVHLDTLTYTAPRRYRNPATHRRRACYGQSHQTMPAGRVGRGVGASIW